MKSFKLNNQIFKYEVCDKFTNKDAMTIRVIANGVRNIYTWNAKYPEPYACKDNKAILDISVVKHAYHLEGFNTNAAVVTNTNVMYKVESSTGAFALFNNKTDAFDYALGKTVTITEVQVSISDTPVTPVDIVPTADTVVADEIVIVSDVEEEVEEVIVEETNTPPKRRKKRESKEIIIKDDDDEIDQGLAAALDIL